MAKMSGRLWTNFSGDSRNRAATEASDEDRGGFFVGEDFFGLDHRDDVPRADLGAELAADAALEVDGADAHGIAGVLGIVDLVDAIDRADGDAGVTAGAEVLVEDGELFRQLLSHRSNGL